MSAQQAREPATLRQDDDPRMSPRRDHRDDGHPSLDGEPVVAAPPVEDWTGIDELSIQPISPFRPPDLTSSM